MTHQQQLHPLLVCHIIFKGTEVASPCMLQRGKQNKCIILSVKSLQGNSITSFQGTDIFNHNNKHHECYEQRKIATEANVLLVVCVKMTP